MIDVALIKSLGTSIGGGASVLLVGALVLFPSKDELARHEAEFHAYQAADQAGALREQIGNTIERAAVTPDGEYKQSLCKQLQQALAQLCEIAEKDAMCQDRAILQKQAGCS